MMRSTVPTVVAVALVVTGFALPGAVAHHKASHTQGQADVAAKSPTGADADMSSEDEDGATVGVQVNPSAGSSKTVQVTVTVDDPNGHNDIDTVEVTIYEPDNATVEVATATASKQTGNGKRATYKYSFNMDYFDEPGTYHVKAVVTDRDGSTDTAWAEFEWTELAALSLTTSTVSLNPNGSSSESVEPGSDTHATNTTVTIENHGNVQVDLQYEGTDLTDGSGNSIAVSNVHWSEFLDLDPENAFAATSQTNATFDLAPGDGASKDVYLAIHVPNVPAGTYTGTLTLTAVKG